MLATALLRVGGVLDYRGGREPLSEQPNVALERSRGTRARLLSLIAVLLSSVGAGDEQENQCCAKGTSDRGHDSDCESDQPNNERYDCATRWKRGAGGNLLPAHTRLRECGADDENTWISVATPRMCHT